MKTQSIPWIRSLLLSMAATGLFIVTFRHPDNERLILAKVISTPPSTKTYPTGWQPVGHSPEEQRRLQDMSTMIAAWPASAEDNVPTVPCLSADGHLLVLSAAASRTRYGTMITFMMVYPTDLTKVLPTNVNATPLSPHALNLWCIFHDGSVTPAYSYDSNYGNDRVSLLDCPLTPFAIEQLWLHRQTLRVYLASLTDKDRNAPILKAFVTVPRSAAIPQNHGQEQLTLCTSPLHNGAQFLIPWVLFHVRMGFRRFVIYNTTDHGQQLKHAIDTIHQHYPDLIDVVPWNFSALSLKDVFFPTRYFQIEALHDCLVRYGDQSEWLGTLDLDEYVVPLPPYDTVAEYLHSTFGRRIVGSINLWSQFFCTNVTDRYTGIENDTNRLVFERFIHRARDRFKGGREKFLYRPRFIQYLSIHHQLVGLSKEEPSPSSIMLAHFGAMAYLRSTPGCDSTKYVKDETLRDRFAQPIKTMMEKITNTTIPVNQTQSH